MYLKKNKRKLEGKKIVLVCNKYSTTAGKITSISKYLGLKTNVYVIHYNPWIINATNGGLLPVVYNNIKLKKPMVVELNNDVMKLASAVSKIKIGKLKQSQEERKVALEELAKEREKEQELLEVENKLDFEE